MKVFKISLAISLALLLAPLVAEAHVLKTDGSIGAVLHVDPADDPVAGQSSSFLFEFKDKQNKFNMTDCNCQLEVYRSGKQIYTSSLQAGSGNTGAASYTFPERGVYTVGAMGQPFSAAAFQPFSLKFDIRVDRVSAKPKPGGFTKIIYVTLGLVLVGTVLIYILRRKIND